MLVFSSDCLLTIKVRKVAKIRDRYNQVPHLTQDTTWESDKTQLNITNKVSPFLAGDHKAANNRRESITNKRHIINNTNGLQKKYRLGTVSKNILLEGFFVVSSQLVNLILLILCDYN